MAETAQALAGPAMVGHASVADVAVRILWTGATHADRHLRT
jgi:hypothetical protein